MLLELITKITGFLARMAAVSRVPKDGLKLPGDRAATTAPPAPGSMIVLPAPALTAAGQTGMGSGPTVLGVLNIAHFSVRGHGPVQPWDPERLMFL